MSRYVDSYVSRFMIFVDGDHTRFQTTWKFKFIFASFFEIFDDEQMPQQNIGDVATSNELTPTS